MRTGSISMFFRCSWDFNCVSTFSKKIQALGVNDEQNPTSGTALSLQTKIRLSAINFLKENLLGLPNLPSEDQFEKLQAERR